MRVPGPLASAHPSRPRASPRFWRGIVALGLVSSFAQQSRSGAWRGVISWNLPELRFGFCRSGIIGQCGGGL